MISLEELKKHLEGLLPKISRGKKVPEEDVKMADALLDVYLWAKKKAENA